MLGCAFGPEAADDDWRLAFVPVPVEGDFIEITDLAFFPDSSEFLALDRAGNVSHYFLSEKGASFAGSFRVPNAQPSWDCGLISVAFDPDFHENRFVFFSACMPDRGAGIVRVTYQGDGRAIERSARLILRMNAPEGRGQLHRMGSLGFERDGTMWALVGDMNTPGAARDATNPLGSLVRIVPSRDPEKGGYDVPEGNAFGEGGAESPLIYAWGFRMPWRGAIDARGRYWVGDVGGSYGPEGYEEINLVTHSGQDFGWPLGTGPSLEAGSAPADAKTLRRAFAYWGREDDHPYLLEDPPSQPHSGRVAWVGRPYRRNPRDRYEGRLYERILYGDLCVGFLRAVELDASHAPVFHRKVADMPYVSAVDQAPDGYLYAARMGGCTSDTSADGGSLLRVELRRTPSSGAP